MPSRRRDNIQGITKPALKRLTYTAGITEVSGLIYEELRGILKSKMEDVINKAVKYTTHYRYRTIDEYIIADSVSPKMWAKSPKAKSCGTPKKSRRRKVSGQKALENIKFYQNRSNCLNLSRLPFERLTREIGQDFATDLRFTKNAFILLQYAMENYLVGLLKKAHLAAIAAKRIGVQPKDLQLARRMKMTW